MAARAFATLFALVLLAGCLGGADPVADAATEDPAPGASPAPAGAAKTEGAATTTAPATAGAPQGAQEGNVSVPVEQPLAWEGHIGRSACVPSGLGSCVGLPVVGTGSDTFHPTGLRASRASLTLTWTAAAPTTERLVFYLLPTVSCGENCYEWGDAGEVVEGTSPITVDAAEFDMAEDETLSLFVGVPGRCHTAAMVVFACASLVEQEFLVEGTILAPPQA